ncbi:MAG: carboxypeptidase-like regulatory domain-containing protein [Thermoplasmatota archaeon]
MKHVWMLFVALAFAGCAGEDSGDQTTLVDKEEFQLKAGKGAIAGLLIDDRFRPIPEALILLQPIGLTATTNENGEFNFVDLDPETYTLRTQVDGYEAKPIKVRVTEGIFEDAQIPARRLATEGENIITEHHAAFIACNVSRPDSTLDCGNYFPPDVSGDTNRQHLRLDYQKYGSNITYFFIEMHSSKEASASGPLKMVMRAGANSGNYYINELLTEGQYLKAWAKYNETSPFDLEQRNHPWLNDVDITVQLWAQGQFKQETQTVFGPLYSSSFDSRGVGIQYGIKANYLVTLFLGEPDVDIETYCALCQ